MALVVGEQRNSGALFAFLAWLLILFVVGVGGYYVFFKNPSLIEVTPPPGFQSTEQIAKIELDPQEVVSDPAFQSLRQYVTPPSAGTVGRPNPFLGQ